MTAPDNNAWTDLDDSVLASVVGGSGSISSTPTTGGGDEDEAE